MTDNYGETHRKQMQEEIERQDRNWRSMNRRNKRRLDDWLMSVLFFMAGVIGMFIADRIKR